MALALGASVIGAAVALSVAEPKAAPTVAAKATGRTRATWPLADEVSTRRLVTEANELTRAIGRARSETTTLLASSFASLARAEAQVSAERAQLAAEQRQINSESQQLTARAAAMRNEALGLQKQATALKAAQARASRLRAAPQGSSGGYGGASHDN